MKLTPIAKISDLVKRQAGKKAQKVFNGQTTWIEPDPDPKSYVPGLDGDELKDFFKKCEVKS